MDSLEKKEFSDEEIKLFREAFSLFDKGDILDIFSF
jgi:hypothetical protein